MGKLRENLRADLQAEKEDRRFGSGWISGVLALFLAMAGLIAVLCLRYPELLTTEMVRAQYDVPLIRVLLHIDLILAFGLAVLNLALRRQKIMGFTAITGVLIATLLGGSQAESSGALTSGIYFGLDWFLLNLAFLGIVFIPLGAFLRAPSRPVDLPPGLAGGPVLFPSQQPARAVADVYVAEAGLDHRRAYRMDPASRLHGKPADLAAVH
jgi:hypothetical protein